MVVVSGAAGPVLGRSWAGPGPGGVSQGLYFGRFWAVSGHVALVFVPRSVNMSLGHILGQN